MVARFLSTERKKEPVKQPEQGRRGGRIRELWNKYGAVAIVTYVGVYGATLTTLYIAIDTGMIVAVDVVPMLKSVGADRLFDLSLVKPKAGNFAVAWILTKFTEPLRALATVALTPSIARLLGKR